MSDSNNDETFSLKVLVNKERTKVLFAEADDHFVDIYLSFMTLPLGRIAKLLEKHYVDEAPSIGSLTTLYRSLANLDTAHFWTQGAKMALLDPRSSFEAEYQQPKLDIFFCSHYHKSSHTSPSVRDYYFDPAACSKGAFTTHTSFVITDDLQILPNAAGLLGIITALGITNAVRDMAEQIKVTLRYNEIMNLLKATLISQTPLSDLILNKKREMNSVTVGLQPKILSNHIKCMENPNTKKMILKAVIQKSTSKLLYVQAEEDFFEFLFSLLYIPVGGVERLRLGDSKTCVKAIHNLCRSTDDLIDGKYFKTSFVKDELIRLNVLPDGCISYNFILPLVEDQSMSDPLSSKKFPMGEGSYLQGPQSYQVMDDLTVTPFCIVSILAGLDELKIPTSDVEEVKLQVGLKEALGILKASLTSTSALSDALPLLNRTSNKKRKIEF